MKHGLRCEDLDTRNTTAGDLYCCVPTLPPAGSLPSYWNAASGAPRTSNPDYGFTSFDFLPQAALVVYRSITMEGWATFMQVCHATRRVSNPGLASLG